MSADDAARLRALARRLGAAHVPVELVELADPQWIVVTEERTEDGQLVGIVTVSASNRVVQYRVLGSDDRWGLAGVTCERIDEATPTRDQLLTLKPGGTIRAGRMTAHRPIQRFPREPNVLQFRKWFTEGSRTVSVPDEQVRDMLPDPWATAEQWLDEGAQAS